MSWTDVKSIETIKKIRDAFGIKVFVETGTFRGDNARVHAANFDMVMSVEAVEEYYKLAWSRTNRIPNIFLAHEDSTEYLKRFRRYFMNKGTIFFYLDAHFYDPNLHPDDRWVVIKELKALEGFENCVICIHDFKCNGLGHLNYDGQPLDFELIEEHIRKVNPNFHYYFNALDRCEILTKEMVRDGRLPNLELDEYIEDTLDFVWGKPETIDRAYRGILYATPKPLDLTTINLTESR